MEIAPFFRGRATLLYGLMSTYWLWASEEGWPVAEHEGFLSGWIPKNFDSNLLWGEGAVPQFLAHYWFISKVDPSWESEKKHLTGLLASLVFLNLNEAHQEFPTPYFTFEDSMRHRLAPLLRSGSDPLEDETTQGTSYFAEGVLHLLVRANLKQTAKSIWPAFTNLGLKRFDPEQNWHYCLYHCGEGQGWERMVQTPPTRNWTDLVEDARDCRAPGVPEALLAENVFCCFSCWCCHIGQHHQWYDFWVGSSERSGFFPHQLNENSNEMACRAAMADLFRRRSTRSAQSFGSGGWIVLPS
jgi:hypothetical protein